MPVPQGNRVMQELAFSEPGCLGYFSNACQNAKGSCRVSNKQGKLLVLFAHGGQSGCLELRRAGMGK